MNTRGNGIVHCPDGSIEDQRQWLYEYTVRYDIGYECAVGFNSQERENMFHSLIAEARKKFRDCYNQPHEQAVMWTCTDAIFFDGWSATVSFTEWGPNRKHRNWPSDIEYIDKIINHVVNGMGGTITKRTLLEMPIELVDVSERLYLPLQKRQCDEV